MRLLTPAEAATVRSWFLPDRPGPLIGLHVLATGHGTWYADRWPAPRAVVVETVGNYAMRGDPSVVDPIDLRAHVTGFVDAPATWLPLLRAVCPDLQVWDRVIFALPPVARFSFPEDQRARRLGAEDSQHLAALSNESHWIANTWGGYATLAASGMGWGAFVDGRLAALSCPFFVGERYEDIGIVTEPEFRGRGLAVACAGGVCDDIHQRQRIPSWTTSPDNRPSIRVAEKLGFAFERVDSLYAIGVAIPLPATSLDHER